MLGQSFFSVIRSRGILWSRRLTFIHDVITENDRSGDKKENEIVNIESQLAGIGEGTGDHLCDNVLHDQNRDGGPKRRRADTFVGTARGKDEKQQWRQAEGDQRDDDSSERLGPVSLPLRECFRVNVGPAFETIFDRKSKTKQKAQVKTQTIKCFPWR